MYRALLLWAGRTLGALLAVACLTVIAGGLLQRPLLIAAIPTGSMEPVLRKGDLVLILPLWLSPPPVTGSIIVFRTVDVPWGVHRVVHGDAAAGFVTRGDANEQEDRLPVFPQDVTGTVPEWFGGPVRLANLGSIALELQVLRKPYVIGALMVAALVLMVVDGMRRRPVQRRRPNPLPVYAALVFTTWAALTIQSVVTVQKVEGEAEVLLFSRQGLLTGQILAGSARIERQELKNPLPLPVAVVVVSSVPYAWAEPGHFIVPPFSEASYTLTVSPPPRPGKYKLLVRRAFYLPVLPPALLAVMARIHPHLAGALAGAVPALLVSLLTLADPAGRRVVRFGLMRFQSRFEDRFGL